MEYTVQNQRQIETPEGADYFGDLFCGRTKIGEYICLDSQGDGPWVRFTDRLARAAFEGRLGPAAGRESALYALYNGLAIGA